MTAGGGVWRAAARCRAAAFSVGFAPHIYILIVVAADGDHAHYALLGPSHGLLSVAPERIRLMDDKDEAHVTLIGNCRG